jgi:DnaJ-class molecular chaperone
MFSFLDFLFIRWKKTYTNTKKYRNKRIDKEIDSSMSNHYETLGVPKDVSTKELKRKYRELSLQYHPDKPGGSTEKFQQINEAYETLSDPARKDQYDNELNGFGSNPFMRQSSMNEFHDIHQFFNAMFQGGGGGGGGGPGSGGINFAFGPGVHVFNGGFPPNFAGGIFQNMQKPPPIIKNITITLQQCFVGGSFPLEYEYWEIENNVQVNKKGILNIDYPAGLNDGEIVILRDHGHKINDALRGDIKLIIKVENHPEFQRNGLDIIYKKKITLKESLCGFSFDFNYLNGKNMLLNHLNHTNIIKPGYKKILSELGIRREHVVGNLIIEFEIEFPDELSEEQIQKLSSILP